MTNAALRTRATTLFGVDFPIVQTGMGWVAGARLTSATSAAGGLGILASATMTLDQLRDAIHAVKERTDRPFGVNLRSDAPDAGDRIDLLIAEGVKVASFALAPGRDQIKKLKDHGLVVVPSIGARRHAEKVAEWGVDAVIVQGGEGGGHTGPVPTTLLLPQVVDAIDLPVIAAGGFFDGRGLVAALAYGASGVAMGTRFLLTRESTVPDVVKQAYLERGGHRHGRHHAGRRRAPPRAAHRVRRAPRTRRAGHEPAARGPQRARVQEAVGHLVARRSRPKASRCARTRGSRGARS